MYAFFGNAVDNAIEAVEKLSDDKKFISLTVSPGEFIMHILYVYHIYLLFYKCVLCANI